MGIRRKITLPQLNHLLKKENYNFVALEATVDGISDTTYVVIDANNKKYIFKIYEFAGKEKLQSEVELLEKLKGLPTPKSLLSKDFSETFEGKNIGLFSYLEGVSLNEAKREHLVQIGNFLGDFHEQTYKVKTLNPNVFTTYKLKELHENIQNFDCSLSIKNRFLECYNQVKNLELEEDGIIHGDLFLDNTKFQENKLTAVFDFIEACHGSFVFDLAVVVNAWCFDMESHLNVDYLEVLLDTYNQKAPKKIESKSLKEVMLFATFFYAVKRFNTKYIEKRNVNVKSYEESLLKFDDILISRVELKNKEREILK